jgi:hypothetical protein
LKTHNSALLSSSSKIRKPKDRSGFRLKRDRLFKEGFASDEMSCSSESNMDDKNTNEILPKGGLLFGTEPFFMDQDGMEISVIEQK